MRLASIEVVPYALRFREPYVTSRGTLERREILLVRLRTQEGIEGLGEAVPLSLRGGASLPELTRELRESGGALGEDLSTPARAALEMAWLDIEAKAAGTPAWQVLGATTFESVRCNATLTAGAPEDVARRAERWGGLGFRTFKLKVGMPGDVAQVAAVRAVVGEDARLRLDANGAWSTDEAILKLRTLERHRIELAEQPAADLADLRLVNEETAIPIAADESVASELDARRAVELGACGLATVKLSKVGGIGAAIAIGKRLRCYLSSALDGPVGIAAAAHAAQALRERGLDAGVAHGLATQLLFTETIAARGPDLHADQLEVPDVAGLGVEVDEAALARARI